MKVDADEKFKYHPNLIFIKEENGFYSINTDKLGF